MTMEHATESSTITAPGSHSSGRTRVYTPVTPGKVAMWLFLATEVMFFTGLIGSYIVLRSGSPHAGYSNLYSPTTDLRGLDTTYGVFIHALGPQATEIEHVLQTAGGQTAEQAAEIVHHEHGLISHLTKEKAESLHKQLEALGAEAVLEPLKAHKWPLPYDELTNPLAINLTAGNTFVLICSSVTMVLALAAIQQGNKVKCSMYLLATVCIGSLFLSVQIYEYYQLMVGHHYPPGISATSHFRPSSSLFASCFFTMTGFHGAHVTGGVILLSLIFIQSFFFGAYSQNHYAPVELAGLYWHFVDLVWIILFTIVYLL
jgi:heme/copper-type cytochrome/quinol oxidase subunit 3